MHITQAAPSSPRAVKPRFDWSPVVLAVSKAPTGTWLRIPLADLPGATAARNQTAIRQALVTTDRPIQTRIEGEYLFVRVIAPNQKTQ